MKEIKRFEQKVWLSSPTTHSEEQIFIKEAFDTNWVAPLGKNVNEFEKEMAAYLGVAQAAALTSGTAALHLAVKLAGVQAGDVIICSDLTFAATVNPVSYENGIQVFVDSERDTWNMNPDALEIALEKYSGKAKAVIVANLYGTPAKLDEIVDLCEKYNVVLIEDAAESLSATYKGRQTGSFGKYNCISFNGNKIITTGGGGAVTGRDEQEVCHMQYLSTQAKDDPQFYIHNETGYNYRMTNLQAALGVAQMEELPEFVTRKNRNYAVYREQLADFELGRLLGFREGTYSNRWFYAVELAMDRIQMSLREIITAMQEAGIQTRAVWGLIHEQLPYRGAIAYEMERAPYYSGCILNLPCSSQITEEQIVYVAEQLKKICCRKS